MDMKEFGDFIPNKFLVVLGKMQAAVFNTVHQHIKELGFNSTEFLVMYAIAAHGALTIQDIAARISVTSGNMTYTIDKLEKRKVIHRIPCPEDRRRIYVDFTVEGKELWTSLIQSHTEFLEEAFSNVDQQVLLDTIEHMKLIGKTIK